MIRGSIIDGEFVSWLFLRWQILKYLLLNYKKEVSWGWGEDRKQTRTLEL